MSSVQLLFGPALNKSIGGVNIDAFLMEQHSDVATVTQYPVEDGANAADHVSIEIPKLSLDCVIGPNSIYEDDVPDPLRAITIYENLRKVFTDRKPVDVVTGLRVYSNMIITSISPTRSADNGGSLNFSCQMTQIKIASAQYVKAAKIPATAKAAKPKESVGKTPLIVPTLFEHIALQATIKESAAKGITPPPGMVLIIPGPPK